LREINEVLHERIGLLFAGIHVGTTEDLTANLCSLLSALAI
jgi:hypothetical protein